MTGSPVVRTAAGAVRGRWGGPSDEPGASAVFLGIPFARPPVGALRYEAPVAVEPWKGVLDATAHGATPQRGDMGRTLIPEPSVPGESTLNVNVWTPRPGDAEARLPVLVYIHGGGFVSGSPASPWYDGTGFGRAGVVTVTVSYRLGFDGFAHIAGAPANRGVRDWLAALDWVRHNIAAFGGDPGRVTLAGQSAGGGAVLTLLGMPAAQHLFHGAWAMSAATGDVAPERAEALSAALARLAGVPATRRGFASVPEDRLRALQDRAAATTTRGPLSRVRTVLERGLPWGPQVDGELILRPALESIAAGVGADKPLVIGALDDEFTMVTDRLRPLLRVVPASVALARLGARGPTVRDYLDDNPEQRRKGTAAVLGRYVSDAVFRTRVVKTCDARGSAPTWAYRFTWPSPTLGWAAHCLDVPFWFDRLDAPGVTAIAGDTPPAEIATALHTSAVALIRQGDPGWEPWSRSPGATRLFDAAPQPIMDSDGYATVRALVGG